MQFSVLLTFVLASVASAASTARLSRRGTQFITGPCRTDSDCADGCCGFNTGLCAGPIVAQENDGGCGHGDPEPNNNAAVAVAGPNAPKPSGASIQATTTTQAAAGAATTKASTTASTSAAQGTQFITGPCKSDSDCADGCCGFNTGLCAGPVVAQEVDGGCGHGDPEPNNNAAVAVAGPNAPKPSGASTQIAATKSTGDSSSGATSTAATSAATGTQFITGPCQSDSDCADGCCGFNTGLCAGPIVAQEIDGGCGHGDPQPNNNAAVAVAGPNAPKPSGASTQAAATKATGESSSAATSTAPATTATGDSSSAATSTAPATKATGDSSSGATSTAPATKATGDSSSGATSTAATSAATGTQFITGPCNHDSDCANGCCGFNTGLCAGAIVAQERDGGCGHGDPQPNNNAAVALVGPNAPKPGQKD